MSGLTYVCDKARHLICLPFSTDNLHRMAEALEIPRCWYHGHPRHPHYDIPKRRIDEVTAKCRVVSTRELLAIIKEALES